MMLAFVRSESVNVQIKLPVISEEHQTCLVAQHQDTHSSIFVHIGLYRVTVVKHRAFTVKDLGSYFIPIHVN